MPCTYDESPWEREQRAKLAELDRVTRLLCSILKPLGRDHPLFDDAELLEWWAEHQRRDARRAADDAAMTKTEEERRAALSKLTPEERTILGIQYPVYARSNNRFFE